MWTKLLLKAALFIAFVPGVLITLPSVTSDRRVVLVTHAVLYVLASVYLWKLMKKM